MKNLFNAKSLAYIVCPILCVIFENLYHETGDILFKSSFIQVKVEAKQLTSLDEGQTMEVATLPSLLQLFLQPKYRTANKSSELYESQTHLAIRINN